MTKKNISHDYPPAPDELGTSRANLVSPEQSVLSPPVESIAAKVSPCQTLHQFLP